MSFMLSTLPSIISAIKELMDLSQRIRAASRQSGELTVEQDAAYQAQLDAMFAQTHWQPKDK
ncbi:MAG: hypothetical protein FJ167_02480 [Gammaproteobacteria bacterium]|nr:hypothetical protein [Gammaproteobacteria bacterium]